MQGGVAAVDENMAGVVEGPDCADGSAPVQPYLLSSSTKKSITMAEEPLECRDSSPYIYLRSAGFCVAEPTKRLPAVHGDICNAAAMRFQTPPRNSADIYTSERATFDALRLFNNIMAPFQQVQAQKSLLACIWFCRSGLGSPA